MDDDEKSEHDTVARGKSRNRERENERARERKRTDPEFAQRRREASKRYYDRKKNDPEWFAKKRESNRRHHAANRESRAAKQRKRYAEDSAYRELHKAQSRRYRLGVDAPGAAIGVCEVCGRERVLFTDHDHVTRQIRGRICNPCNLATGMLGGGSSHTIEDLRVARGLVAYLERALTAHNDNE